MAETNSSGEEAGPPLVTVGVPVYNGAAHLAEALESALAQDYPALEVLVCDNASDDATPTIAAGFAARDLRVRYVRNPENIGLLPNFRRVRDLARGTYFTWLGHDDLLSDPAYLSRTVGFLEEHRDVGLCHTQIRLLNPGGTSQLVEFPELHPDRRWEDARRDLFSWPREWLEMCSHGVFRRRLLCRLPMPERTRTGRPYVFCWEIGVLTALACRSRIVALPAPLRTYRSSTGSAARLIGRQVSPLDLWLLDLETKLTLLRRAAAAPGDAEDRLRLVAVALANFPKPTFRRRFDTRYALRLAEEELAMLLRTAAERRNLLERLKDEIEARRRLVLERKPAAAPATVPIEGPSPQPAVDAAEILARAPAGGPAQDFFRPPAPDAVARYTELSTAAEVLLAHCRELLRSIEEAEADAASLLAAMEEPGG